MKKVLILCLIGIIAMAFCACGSEKATEEEKAEPEVVKIEKNIDAVAEALGLSGKSETFYDMIGAEDGAEFNDGAVEIKEEIKMEVREMLLEVLKITGALLIGFTMLFITGYGV